MILIALLSAGFLLGLPAMPLLFLAATLWAFVATCVRLVEGGRFSAPAVLAPSLLGGVLLVSGYPVVAGIWLFMALFRTEFFRTAWVQS
jgi:hypothetical protein